MFLLDVALPYEAGSVVQPVFFDLLKRIPRDPNDWVDFHNPNFDLMWSVIASQARGCKHPRSCSTLENVVECELSFAGLRGHHQNGVRQTCREWIADYRVSLCLSNTYAPQCCTLQCFAMTAVVSARFGCAQGKHRAKVCAEIVEDWVSRSVCCAWHIPLGTCGTLVEVQSQLQVAQTRLQDTLTSGRPLCETSSGWVANCRMHTTAPHIVLGCGLRTYPTVMRKPDMEWLGCGHGCPTVGPSMSVKHSHVSSCQVDP